MLLPTVIFTSRTFFSTSATFFFTLLISFSLPTFFYVQLFFSFPTFFFTSIFLFFTFNFLFHFQLFCHFQPFKYIRFHLCFSTYYFYFLTCDKTDLEDSWMCRKHGKTEQSNISVFWCFIVFIKAIHGNNISLSTIKTTLPRNGKTTRPLASVKYPQKELLRPKNVRKTG